MNPEAILAIVLAAISVIKEGADAISRLRQLVLGMVEGLPEEQKAQVLTAMREQLGTEAGVRLETWDDLIAWVAPE